MSNSLDPQQDQCSVGPDLGLNYLQRLSADNKSRCKQGRVKRSVLFYFPVQSLLQQAQRDP